MRTRHKSIFVLALTALAALPGAALAKPIFAPYVDLAGYPPPQLAAISKGSGVKRITLGFVTAKQASDCAPTWGGYAEYPASGSDPYRLADVKALRARGGDVVVSFGGQAGTELAAVCSPDALRDAYAAVVDAYGAKRIDFDIEGAAIEDTASNAKRATAIAALQSSHPHVKIDFTLPVLPTGLGADGVAVVKGAKAAGVKIGLVNIMAMDYGDNAAPHPAGRMGAYAIKSAKATRKELRGVFGSSAAKHLSVTPMIGVNDVSTEVFTLADARTLHKWARTNHIGGLRMWQIGRDSQCKQPSSMTQLTCSGVAQKRWAFSRALR